MSDHYATQLLVNNKWRDGASGKRFAVHNPATSEMLAEVAQADAPDVDAAASAASAAFEKGPWGTFRAPQRARYLFRLAHLIREHAEELAVLESKNVGKPIRDSRDEINAGADCFEYYAGAATKLFGETIPVADTGLDFTVREPIGVVAAIVPWNFPFPMACWKAAPALAAGNTVVLKPASYTPMTALMLGELAVEAGFPDGVFNVICGPGRQVGAALVQHAAVGKITFTGETATGREIMKMAADDIKRVSLELGGKSPNIVCADADLKRAAEQSPMSVFANTGQDCCARSRMFVEAKVFDEFLELFIDRTKRLVIGDPLDSKTEIGPMVSIAQRDRVCEYIEIGKKEGAVLAHGGRVLSDGPLAKGAFLEPAVFTNVKPEMRIMREEIFGPVVCATPFDDDDELIAKVNDSDFGLAGTIWVSNITRGLRLASRVKSGVLGINTNHSVHLEAPFGGYKKSGIGRDLGMNALELYTEVKNIFVYLGEGV